MSWAVRPRFIRQLLALHFVKYWGLTAGCKLGGKTTETVFPTNCTGPSDNLVGKSALAKRRQLWYASLRGWYETDSGVEFG